MGKSRRVPRSSPIPLKTIVHVGLVHSKSDVVGQISFRWCGAEVWSGNRETTCCPCHLTTVQNHETSPKITLALLQNRTLM
ncbi:hypothetical protein AVEN_34978-1 [Araneus ventricosus]|uniref:Uncharacterized protein n=1 Tax=Araneus ventricosus TaxID=182803 RepID=A0A4Y2DG87_ARAVE|nr:hypothetical protein AVEN_34978-1 [Araneus ventricosus]